MKKFISLFLVLVLTLTMLAGCGTPKATLEGTPVELIEKIYAQQSVEFAPMTLSPDDPDYSAMWDWYSFTGLNDGAKVKEAAASEPMISSIPFSLVIVRVNDGEDTKAVAQEMKDNINTRKWVCVNADDLQVVGYGDVVMLIMVGSDTGLTSKSFVDAFKAVCGAELDFVI